MKIHYVVYGMAYLNTSQAHCTIPSDENTNTYTRCFHSNAFSAHRPATKRFEWGMLEYVAIESTS
jgi:hypothetical protein